MLSLYSQLFRLNIDFNVTIGKFMTNQNEKNEFNVTIGKNEYFDDQLLVEEILNLYLGLCYAFTFEGKLDSAANELLTFKVTFENGRKVPPVEFSFISPETR